VTSRRLAVILSEGGIHNCRVHLEDVMNTEQAHHPIHRSPWSSDQAPTTRQAVPLLGVEQRGDTWKPEEGHPVAVDDDGRVRGQRPGDDSSRQSADR
jgi:hypothetical protein